jgi:hypothetical protein
MNARILVCGNVFDGISDALTGPAEIVEDNRIAKIARSVGRPSGARVIDISERTVSPGFTHRAQYRPCRRTAALRRRAYYQRERRPWRSPRLLCLAGLGDRVLVHGRDAEKALASSPTSRLAAARRISSRPTSRHSPRCVASPTWPRRRWIG